MTSARYISVCVCEAVGLSGFLFTAIAGVVNFVATFPAILLVDRYGRARLLQCSAVGMFVSCVGLALAGNLGGFVLHELGGGYYMYDHQVYNVYFVATPVVRCVHRQQRRRPRRQLALVWCVDRSEAFSGSGGPT